MNAEAWKTYRKALDIIEKTFVETIAQALGVKREAKSQAQREYEEAVETQKAKEDI